MGIHQVLISVMAVFAALGAVDRVFNNQFGLGKQFEEGIQTMGSLALAMIGMIALSPVLAEFLRPIVVPVYRFLGADPAMFAGTLLANDMGAGPLAQALAEDPQAALLGGVICGSMLGVTLVFTIPVALGFLPKQDRPYLAKGVLAGIITVPAGVLVGGLTAGFSLGMVLRNLTPILLLSVIIALGLWKAEKAVITCFYWIGKGILAVITIGLTASITESLTGIVIIPGMTPIEEGFQTVGEIAIVLAGAFPLIFVVTKILNRPLLAIGRLMGINEIASAGLVASLANSIATFGMLKDMDDRGKVINVAFAVSAAFVFGDHMGYTAGFAPEMLPAVIAGKLTGGVTAVLLALLMTKSMKE